MKQTFKWVFDFERKEGNTFIIREARLPIFQETPTFVMINDFIDFSVCKICARVRRTLPIFCTSKQRYIEYLTCSPYFFTKNEFRILNIINFSVCNVCAGVRKTPPILFCTSKQRYFDLCDLLTPFFQREFRILSTYYWFFCMQYFRTNSEMNY